MPFATCVRWAANGDRTDNAFARMPLVPRLHGFKFHTPTVDLTALPCCREADTFVGSGSERDETVQVLSGDNDDGGCGWKKDLGEPSLPESYASIAVPPLNAPVWKKLLAFSGMGLLISV